MLRSALDGWRLPYAPPDGAFYFWVDVSTLGGSRTVADRWLDEAGVAVTPGIDFDPVEGDRFVRVSYSESPEDVAAAIARLDPLIS
jgi:aspartate/methionine/tyrosine aminotransferase